MKRTLALTLTVLLVLTMIPASLLNVLARGPGVAANVTPNQTIPRADGQFIPETVVVDGETNDTGWPADDWNEVSSDTGTWSVQYPSDANVGYSYRYQLKADYYFLYGAVELKTAPVGLVTIFLNDGSAKGKYTDIFTFDVEEKVFNRVEANGTAIVDKSPNYYEKSKFEIVEKDDGSVVIEFKSLLADFCPEKNPSLTYFVSVECNDGESLYHPMIEINENFDRNNYFPSQTYWPEGFAATIGIDDIQGYGDDSFEASIEIDGEFDESFWAQHTDFYSRWYERTNLPSYKDGLKDYSILEYNKLAYANSIGGEHDVRVSADYLYGAALVQDDYAPSSYYDTYVYFNMFEVYSTGNYDQLIVVLRKDFNNNSTWSYAYAKYQEVRDNVAGGFTRVNAGDTFVINGVTTSYLNWGGISTGAYDMYSFEFSMPRGAGYIVEGTATNLIGDFAPTEYSLLLCAYPNNDATDDYTEINYTYSTSASAYPVKHFCNSFGEYYNPYTTYTADGYLGEKAWPGLTSSADGDFNGDWVNIWNDDSTARKTDRTIGANYMHSLRADYEFAYGAVHIQNTGDYFGDWKHGTATSPAGGDYFSVYLASATSGTGAVYRYDMWTYLDDEGNVVPAIAGYGGGTYYFKPTVTVGFSHRVDDVWAFEYRIPLSSIDDTGLLYSQSVKFQESSADSPEILRYYTVLNVAADGDYEGEYCSLMWPKSGNTVLPGDASFTWDNYNSLRYENVIRSIEPDGKITEAQRIYLESVGFTNSEYRDISESGNVLTGYKKFAVGKDYAYIAARFNGDLVANTTRAILWIKNSAGTIYKYDWYFDGTYNQMVVNGSSDYIQENFYCFSTANGMTNFEAVITIDDFGGDQGFEYYLEIQQSLNGEVLNRVAPKIKLPTITGYADYFNLEDNDWTQNCGSVRTLVHFDPEKIEIDGYLNDNGWDPDEWIYVSPDINASNQETQILEQLMKSEFYYQLRVDDEYLYVGAVLKYHQAWYVQEWDQQTVYLDPTYENIIQQEPGFRIWLKSGTNGQNVKENNSNSYTRYYDIKINKQGQIVYQSNDNTFPTYPNNTRPLFNKYYEYVNPDMNGDGYFTSADMENGNTVWDVVGADEKFETARQLGYGESLLWGYDKYLIKENEAVVLNDKGQTKGESINPEDYEANDMLEGIEPGTDSGIMVSGSGRSMYREDSQVMLGDDNLVVEFKVKLDEFGGDEQFQYYISSGMHADWGGARATMYPSIASEVDSSHNYFHYYYPFWYWRDGNAVTVTKAIREDMTLRTYKKPVITLGAKVSSSYTYKGQEVNAIRLGGLWTEEYIRKVNGLMESNGYNEGADGKSNYTDYWDVNAMGMLIMPTHLVKENVRADKDDQYSEHPGKYELFKETSGAVWMDADGMVQWAGNSEDYSDEHVNFADYTNYAFYVTIVNAPENMNFCFRGFVDYYDDCNNSVSYYDVILERSMNMVVDKATNASGGAWDENVALRPGKFEDNVYIPGTGTSGDDKVNQGGSGGEVDDTYEGITPAPDADQKTIAYVPLDNRPVNIDRVQYAASASGFTLRMPDEADYVTVTDYNLNAGNGTYAHGGNPENILDWLKSQELAGVDYYVISLDQVFSGGLCESRLQSGAMGDLEKEIADYIIRLAKDSNNRVVLGDTLMRLAPEEGYKNFTGARYNVLRAYGMQDRLVLTDGDLTLENVISNYTTAPDWSTLPTTVTHWSIEGGTDTVSEADLTTHLGARARKLTLIDYVLKNAGTNIDKIFIAVDDSSSSNNIQVNDRNYIEKTAGELGVNYKMFAGADELGILGIAEIASYKYTRNDVPVNLVYFGNGKDINPADSYDYASLDTSITTHLQALGAYSTGNRDKDTLQILVLTREDDENTLVSNANALATQLKANLQEGIPTCIIDACSPHAGNNRVLSNALLNTAWGNDGYNLGEVLSYSCWNTVGNTVGIGLSNAISRFTYIYNNDPTVASNDAFVKGLTFSLVKDQAYKAHTAGNVNGAEGVYTVTYDEFGLDYETYDSVKSILAKLNSHNTILGQNGSKVTFGTVSVSNVEWTWDREFECRFDIGIEESTNPDEPEPEPIDPTVLDAYYKSSGTDSMYDVASNSVVVIASEDYYDGLAGAGYWTKALLEYDDVANNYKVIAVEGLSYESDTPAYTSWTTGIDRIAIFAHMDDGSTDQEVITNFNYVANLQVGQRLTLSGATHSELQTVADGAISGISFEQVATVVEPIVKPEVTNPTLAAGTPNSIVVAYVPLDDRPVHTDRVQYLAQASGITLNMPSADDYATVLGTDGHGGNTANILAWLQAQETAGVDYYVIALDQVFSGGLVNSRYSDSSYNGNLVGADLTTVQFLTDLAKNNYVVYTDTVMRLASTSGYREHDATLYEALRTYGEATRSVVADADLTIDNVISSYRYGTNGVTAITRGTDEVNIKGYLAARERKLRIIDYLVKNAGANINRLMIGIDDSSSGWNLQANEVKYIQSILNTYDVNGTVFAGADEMGLMGIAALTSDVFPTASADKGKVPVNVTYFGNYKTAQADVYDNGSLETAINKHLAAIGAYQVPAANANDPGVIQVLVLTRGGTDVDLDTTELAAHNAVISPFATQLANQIQTNLINNVPTCVIDASNHSGGCNNLLGEAMVANGVFGRNDLTELLGFSQWNTVGNAIGISLANAIGRYNYLMNAETVTVSSDYGFMQALTFSFVKDLAYHPAKSTSWNYGTTTGSFNLYNIETWVRDSEYCLGKNCESVLDKTSVGFSSVTWPWDRAFEARIPVSVWSVA